MKTERPEVVVRGRRWFLRGAVGGMLAIPCLPSLLSGRARAQPTPVPRNYVAMATAHGGVWFQNMYPAVDTLTESTTYAARTIRRGNLRPSVSAGRATLSPVLSAPSGVLTPGLAAKMNVLVGFDFGDFYGHHSGGNLGNYAAAVPGTGDGIGEVPTIDQVIAWHPDFYADGSYIWRSRFFGIGDQPISWGYADPERQTGGIQRMTPTNDTRSLYQQIADLYEEDPTPTPAPNPRTPLVDRVIQSYRNLRDGSRRISSSDRERLDQHLSRLSELERRTTETINLSCGGIAVPSETAGGYAVEVGGRARVNDIRWHGLVNDFITTAFSCGATRVVTIGANDGAHATFVGGYDGMGWHNVAHRAATGSRSDEDLIVESHQGFFEHAFLDLISKLDSVDTGRGTLLDESLVNWGQESGEISHTTANMPAITAGGAGGTLNTGRFIDYRNLNRRLNELGSAPPDHFYSPGLMWAQWLGTQLEAMGLPRASFEVDRLQPTRPARAGRGGYGPIPYDPSEPSDWHHDSYPVMGEIPVYLRSGT
ncbi:MAG: DUF1552 domain-containing protein [Myxococcota bacterium]